jgi:hypothetical protein
MFKRGIEMSFQTIVYAVIALLVLVVLVIIIGMVSGKSFTGMIWFLSCDSRGGQCSADSEMEGFSCLKTGCGGDDEPGPYCCIPHNQGT